MVFEAPALLWGLALLSLPVLLHFLMKDKPKDLPFPTLRFLKEAKEEQARRLRFRHLLLLLARLAALLLFVLALARPKVQWSDAGGGKEGPVDAVFVIDDSFSMTARLGEVAFLEEARRRAAAAAEDLPTGSRFSLATASSGPMPFTLRPVELRAEAERVEVDWEARSLDGAIARTLRFLADRDAPDRPAEVYVFSDGTRRALSPEALRDWPPGVTLTYVDLAGAGVPNFYLLPLALSSTAVAPGSTVEIQGALAASGPPGPRVIDLVVGGRTKESRTVDVGPDAPARFTFTIEVDRPGTVAGEVRLRESDPLPADDVRYFAIEVEESRRIVLVVDDAAYAAGRLEGKWLTLGLALDPAGDRRRIQRIGRRPRDLTEAGLAGCKVVVLPDVAGLGEEAWAALRRFVAGGGGLLVLPGPGTMLHELTEPSAVELLPAEVAGVEQLDRAATPVDLDSTHPVLSAFEGGANGDLPAARFRSILRVEPRPESKVPLRFDVGARPAWVERAYGTGRVVLFTGGCHPDWTDFGRHLSFLPFLHETIRWLAGGVDGRADLAAGGTAEIPLPAQPRRLRLVVVGPTDRPREVAIPPGATTVRPRLTEGPGQYSYVISARDGAAAEGVELPIRGGFSANVDAAESELDRYGSEELERIVAGAGAGAAEGVHDGESFQASITGEARWASLVPLLVVLALLAVTLENYLSNFFYR